MILAITKKLHFKLIILPHRDNSKLKIKIKLSNLA